MTEETFLILASELKTQAALSSDKGISFSIYIRDMANTFLREYQGQKKADLHESSSGVLLKEQWKCLILVKKIIEMKQ